MAKRRPQPSLGALSSEDARLVKHIEDLYGPPRWRWGEWSGVRETLAPTQGGPSPPRKRTSAALVLGTMFLIAIALFAWYAAVSDRQPLEQALMAPLRAAGIARPTPIATPTAEYVLALQTQPVGELLPPSEVVIRQIGALLDQMAPKCIEDRFALAHAVIAAHDTFASRGIQRSALSLLTQVNATLSDQTRQRWPTSCTQTLIGVTAQLRP